KAIRGDVSEENEKIRQATAYSNISLRKETLERIQSGQIGTGEGLGVARAARRIATKKTSDLIPMCHPLMITSCNIDYEIDEVKSNIKILATVKIVGKTGVEMEALTAATVCALTIYDMCKAIDKKMVIENTFLLNKIGGKSGEFNFYERSEERRVGKECCRGLEWVSR